MKFLEEQPQARRKKIEDEDGDYIFEPVLKMYNKPKVINEVDAYIDGPILEPSNYRNLLHYLRMMEEGDSLRLWLDSPGGQLDTTLAIIDGIEKTEGDVKVIVTGRAYSAGSIIALAAPQLIIGDHASFMLHNGSYGTGGKANDIASMVIFTTKQFEALFKKVYKDFLTEEEITNLVQGKDYWLDNEEVLRRLEIRAKAQQDTLAKMQKEAKKAAKVQK